MTEKKHKPHYYYDEDWPGIFFVRCSCTWWDAGYSKIAVRLSHTLHKRKFKGRD